MSKLPVFVPHNIVENNPVFVELLSKISKVVSASGVTFGADKTLNEVRSEYEEVKRRYFSLDLLHKELKKFLHEASASSEEWHASALEVLTLAETFDLCFHSQRKRLPSSEMNNVLGLAPDDLEICEVNRDVLRSNNYNICQKMEENFCETCLSLMWLHQPVQQIDMDKQLKAKIATFPYILCTEKQTLLQQQKEHLHEYKSTLRLLTAYNKALMKAVETLKFLVCNVHNSTVVPEGVQELAAKTEGTVLKLRSLCSKFRSDIYTKPNIQAFHQIRRRLDAEFQQAEVQFSNATYQLTAYQTFDPRFQKLVEEYSHLRSEINSNLWVLGELKKKCGD